ncbi:Armadillo repeat-containing protein 7 [Anthophora quadrimaculata]
MFTSREQLIKRTGKNSIGRYDFLKLLSTEFKTTKSKEAKEQVLANLANFAYDPINYGYMRQLQIIDLFLHTLSEDNLKLVRFAVGGICNVCTDPINKLYILRNQGIQLLTSLLSSQDEDVILSVITSLILLITQEPKDEITAETIEKISDLSNHQNNHVLRNVKVGNKISVFKTITKDDILDFAKLTGDYNPLHVESSNNLVHGALLNGLVSGVLGTKIPGPGTIVVEQNLTFPAPCYAGDTIEIKVQIVSVRKIMKYKMYPALLLLVLYISSAFADIKIKPKTLNNTVKISTTDVPIGCTCGIFLSGQLKKDSKEPTGIPAVIYDQPETFSCTPIGNRLCINKCLETIVKYLPNSPKIICSSIEHDCYKERAYLFIKNCKSGWINTNLSAGREYCCKDGISYKCPLY